MPDDFLTLPPDDRRDALEVAATQSGRPAYLLEKDVWVVWALQGLFASPLGKHLVFKGGTSLSKGYDVIQRFSEDIDLTYDVRQLIPELAKGNPPIPQTRSQAEKWTDAVNQKLEHWVKNVALPVLQKHAQVSGANVTLTAEGSKIHVNYDPLAKRPDYIPPRVTLEFGARSTGEPAEERSVVCDAAEHLPDLTFPAATPRTMLPKRTFWEKATAVHVFCSSSNLKGDRLSRHWYDLVRLDESGFAQEAFDDAALAKEVAEWKAKFFRAKDKNGNVIDYTSAVSGKLQLVPDEKGLAELKADYEKMVEAGILLGDAEDFDELMDLCADIEKRANSR
jgi:Nucleotidyl transferase AbiEii toxin, Type IV TA system